MGVCSNAADSVHDTACQKLGRVVLVGNNAERPQQSVIVLLLWANLFLGILVVMPVAAIASYTRVSNSGGTFVAGGRLKTLCQQLEMWWLVSLPWLMLRFFNINISCARGVVACRSLCCHGIRHLARCDFCDSSIFGSQVSFLRLLFDTPPHVCTELGRVLLHPMVERRRRKRLRRTVLSSGINNIDQGQPRIIIAEKTG